MTDKSEALVCHKCVGDLVLQKMIETDGVLGTCAYCGEQRPCITLEALGKIVDPIWIENYEPSNPGNYFFGPSGEHPEYLIAEMLESEPEVADDLVEVLADDEAREVIKYGAVAYYDKGSTYDSKPTDSFEYLCSWYRYAHVITHGARFFSKEALALLSHLLAGISDLEYDGDKAPIRMIAPDSDEHSIYRARRANMARDRIKFCLDPAKELGPPPGSAAKPGRMNPSGISVFYGALDRDTCLSEIRLTVGEAAVSCQFDVIRPIHVLDLTVFRGVFKRLSMFDSSFQEKASHLDFLRTFEDRIGAPVRPSDEELSYIPTQAFVEFLAKYHEPRIDAVIYSSSQTNGKGKNIVILQHAAVIEAQPQASFPKDLPTHREHWDDTGYLLWLDSGEEQAQGSDIPNFTPENLAVDEAPSGPFLRAVPDTLQVHEARALKYDLRSAEVTTTGPGKQEF